MVTARATIGERSRFRVRFPGAFTSAAKDAIAEDEQERVRQENEEVRRANIGH